MNIELTGVLVLIFGFAANVVMGILLIILAMIADIIDVQIVGNKLRFFLNKAQRN